jgi:outer membrane protein OmpA-like peptidoglycan-associated protein
LKWTAVERVQFDAGRAEIRAQCAAKIATLAEWMNQDPEILVGLDGHRDDATANDNDPALGERRARAVRDALIVAGVAPSRIVVGDFGDRRSICSGPSEDCLALSRRVDVHAAKR